MDVAVKTPGALGQTRRQATPAPGPNLSDPILAIASAFWKMSTGSDQAHANIRGLHFHDLRREFGSGLMESSAESLSQEQ